MTLFDAYVIVDWSATSKPASGSDSIWIGITTRAGDVLTVELPCNPRTRAEARTRVRDRLLDLSSQQRRVLVGFDFPYGYPHGFAAALGSMGDAPPWRATWDRLSATIRDDARNANNRFEVAAELNAKLGPDPGPFWGCPARRQSTSLQAKAFRFPYPTQTGASLGRLRLAETRLRGVQETWKLFGNGSVGSQALVGIPHVAALRDDQALAGHSRVWPFETGFTDQPAPASGPFVLHAEIWPGIVPIDLDQHAVRDAAQVTTLARHFAALDDRGRLGALFRAPDGLTSEQLATCRVEEGWILGA